MSQKDNEIVSFFLNNGYLLDEYSLELLKNSEVDVNEFLNYLNKLPNKVEVVTREIVNNFFNKFEIIDFEEKVIETSIENWSKILVERYNFLKEIISKNFELKNLVSISNIRKNVKEVSIISLITNIDFSNNTVLVNDLSGSMFLKCNEELINKILVGDVVGLLIENMRIKKIVYPDIPIYIGFKEEKNLTVRIGFKNKEENVVFIDLKKIFENYFFAKVKISNSIFIFIDENVLPKNFEIIDLIKRRNLNPTIPTNKLLIKEIPNYIVVLSKDKEKVLNYKGISIIYLNENICFDINLKSREINKNYE